MALVPHRIKKGQVEHASLGTASRHGVATVASASDAETIAKQPPGPRKENNWLTNPTFSDDARYPAASQAPHNRTKNSYNGRSEGTDSQKPPNGWARYCPLYTSTNTDNFFTLLNNYFLRSRKKDDTYLDIAAEHSTRTFESGGTLIGPPQHRIIGLHGASNHLNSRNNDPDRNYTDIPLYGATTGNISSSSTLADGDGWIKHCYYQIVQNIPANATKAKFGAFVQVTEADDFASKNYASIRVSQDYVDGNQYAIGHTRKVFGQELQIYKLGESNDIPSSTLVSSTAARTNFNWNGPSKDNPDSTENPGIAWPGIRWPSSIEVSGGSGTASSICREFRAVSGTFTLEERTGTYATQLESLLFELCFFECSANITSATGNSTPSGSVRFYAPYVQFYDSSDNVISP